MKGTRAALVAAMLVTSTQSSEAQPVYPTKPVRIVVYVFGGRRHGHNPRIVAPKLTQSLGQQIIVDNRPGAGTMIGGEIVAKSPPDGYTLLMCVSTLATNPVIYRKVPYNAITDFAPVTLVLTASKFSWCIHRCRPAGKGADRFRESTARATQLRLRRPRDRSSSLDGAVPQHDRDEDGARAV